MPIILLAKSVPQSALRQAAAREMPKAGDMIEFAGDRLTDKGPATGSVDEVKATVDGYYLKVKFADGQATLSWDDMREGARRTKSGWLVKADRYARLLARRTDGTPEAMAAEDARLSDLVARCAGPAAVEVIRAADAAVRAKVRGDFGVEYASEGGYAAEVVDFHGLQVVIENPVGSVRAGVDPDGKAWSTELTADYGYISGTEGADGDMVDVFIGPDKACTTAYVARCQVAGKWHQFDEDKVFLGFPSEDAAREAFQANYNDPRFLGGMDTMSMDTLKDRLKKPGRLVKAAPRLLILFAKAHVGPYLRNGKMVNLAGYQGRNAAARAMAGQAALFSDEEAPRPKRKKASPERFDHTKTGDLFADTDTAHAEGDKWVMPIKDAIAEHAELVAALKSPGEADDREALKEQVGELGRMKDKTAAPVDRGGKPQARPESSKAQQTRARRQAVLDLLGEGWKAKAGIEGTRDSYRKDVKLPDGGRIEVMILPQKTVDGNFYVGSYRTGGARPGPGSSGYAKTLDEAKALAEKMAGTKAVPTAADETETALRATWDEKGVPKDQQDALIAAIAGKAAPGAQIGPFIVPDKPVVVFSQKDEGANAQKGLTTALRSSNIETSGAVPGTSRRESGAQEKKMSSKPWYRSFKEWYDDADMPERQADGTWVDLETGLPFIDPDSVKPEPKAAPAAKRADAGMKLDELRARCERLTKNQAIAIQRAKANGLPGDAIAAAEAAVSEGRRLLEGRAKKAEFQAHADMNSDASRKLNAVTLAAKRATSEAQA